MLMRDVCGSYRSCIEMVKMPYTILMMAGVQTTVSCVNNCMKTMRLFFVAAERMSSRTVSITSGVRKRKRKRKMTRRINYIFWLSVSQIGTRMPATTALALWKVIHILVSKC